MQSFSKQIPTKILQNRENFRNKIRNEKTSFLFESKRIKFQSLPSEYSISDDLLIKSLISAENTEEISVFLNELLRRSCEFEKNPTFLLNEKLHLLIPLLIKYLENPEIQYNSCWILINLLFGDTNLVFFCIKSGILSAFLRIIQQEDSAMREQAVWGIANIAGDSSKEIFQEICEEKTVDKLWEMVRKKPLNIEISKNLSWFLSNILKNHYKGDFVIIVMIIAEIVKNNCFDKDLFENLMGVLDQIVKKCGVSNMLEKNFGEIKELIQKIVYYLGEEYEKINENTLSYCMNFIGVFLMGNDEIIQEIVLMKIGDIYQKTSVHKAHKIRQASFWAIGNIFCTNNEIVEFFFTKNPLIFELLIKTIQNDTFFKVKKEAIICLSNAISLCSHKRMGELLEKELIETISSILDIYDPDLLQILLEILEEIFKYGDFLEENSRNSQVEIFLRNPLNFSRLEALLSHNSKKIRGKSQEILDVYFES